MDFASINPQYLIIELAVYVVSLLAVGHASKRSRWKLIELIASMLFGLLLEMLTMAQAQNYHYGRFAVMVGRVPLSVGVGWGLIIYSAMATSDNLRLRTAIRPLLDALLAVHIDLTMDPVANRIGMWVYGPSGGWFDVPYGNYFGWLAAVISFSASMRFLRQRVREPSLLLALLVIPLALLSLGILNQLLLLYLARGYPGSVLVWGLIGLFLLIVAIHSRRCRFDRPPDLLVLAIPMIFQSFFIALIFVNGYAQTVPGLAPSAIAVATIGLLAYSMPSWYHVRERLKSFLRMRRGDGSA